MWFRAHKMLVIFDENSRWWSAVGRYVSALGNPSAKTKSSFYDSKRNLEPPKFKAYEDDSDLDGDDGDDISIMDDITDLPGILHLLGLFALAINYLNQD